MFNDFAQKYVYPVAVMAGSIIGVGFFSLPYVAMKAGILLTLLYFVLLLAVVLAIHLIFAQISLNTPDFKRFPGFVGHHLGKWAKVLSLISSTVGYFGVLLAYLIVGGEFLAGALSPFFGGDQVFYTFVYFFGAVILITLGIKVVAKAELFMLCFLLLSLVIVFAKGFWAIKLGNFFAVNSGFSSSNLFLPYGPIMFALWGIGLIPEAEEMLKTGKNLMNKFVVISTIIPAVIYLLFIFLVLGITGSATTQSGLLGLSDFFGGRVVLISLLAGSAITFTAFIVHGLTFKKILIYDLGIRNWQALVIACFTPFVLFLLGLNSFVPLLSFVGGVLLGIDGILILLMYKKIGGKNIVIFPLAGVFALGIIYQIFYSIF